MPQKKIKRREGRALSPAEFLNMVKEATKRFDMFAVNMVILLESVGTELMELIAVGVIVEEVVTSVVAAVVAAEDFIVIIGVEHQDKISRGLTLA